MMSQRDRITITLPNYTFSLPVNLSARMWSRITNALEAVKTALEGADELQAEGAEAELWSAAEELMSMAEPPPAKPVDEIFTKPALIRMLGEIAEEWRQ